MKVWRPTDYRSMPWKNGLGVTTELYLERGEAQEIGFRLSSAKLTSSGPFSTFSGLERILILTEGPRVILESEHAQFQVEPLTPFYFSGDKAFAATISGEGRDFNVFFDPKKFCASAEVITMEPAERKALKVEADFFLYVLEGEVVLRRIALPDVELAAQGLASFEVNDALFEMEAKKRTKAICVIRDLVSRHDP